MKPLKYEGNALLDFSLINMLDRFSFRKAKFRSNQNNFQKLLAKNKLRRSRVDEPLSMEILSGEQTSLRNDEAFFLGYFRAKQLRDANKKKKSKGEKTDGADTAATDWKEREEFFNKILAENMDEDLMEAELLEEEDDICKIFIPFLTHSRGRGR